MYNQNWHVVYGPLETPADISPDTQVTDATEIVFRMSGDAGDPGPEINVYVYGEYADANGQHEDGSWPPVVVGTQVAYEICEENGDVNDADYEYTQGDFEFNVEDDGIAYAVQGEAERYVSLGDACWDWNGKDPMHRSGGKV